MAKLLNDAKHAEPHTTCLLLTPWHPLHGGSTGVSVSGITDGTVGSADVIQSAWVEQENPVWAEQPYICGGMTSYGVQQHA